MWKKKTWKLRQIIFINFFFSGSIQGNAPLTVWVETIDIHLIGFFNDCFVILRCKMIFNTIDTKLNYENIEKTCHGLVLYIFFLWRSNLGMKHQYLKNCCTIKSGWIKLKKFNEFQSNYKCKIFLWFKKGC